MVSFISQIKMKWLFLNLLFFIGFANAYSSSQGSTTIDELRAEIIDAEELSWQTMRERSLSVERKLDQIIAQHESTASRSLSVDYQEDDMLPLNHLFDWKTLEQDLVTVTKLFTEFRHLLHRQIQDGQEELGNTDFAETVLEDKNWKIKDIFERINRVMVGTGLYYKAHLEAAQYSCSMKQSPQQVLIQLYNTISVIELKAYAMMQFSWMLLTAYNKGNYTVEAEELRTNFEERTSDSQEYLRQILQRAGRQIIRCDPSYHEEGSTYIAVTRLLQGYIENEVDMNNQGTCKENCAFYQHTESYGCFKNQYCAQQSKCHGKLLKCQFFDSDMWICKAPENSLRRYDYIEYENGRVLGKKGTCTRGSSKVDSWWRWLFWHCSYCFCLCDEKSPKSDRYFSLKPVLSNATANKVVTGLRFVKAKRIIHLQIQEGELLPRGIINPETVEWKPLDAFDFRERGVKEGIDYHTLAWDKRAIDLDDLVAEHGFVVTGIRYRMVGTHMNLELRVTEMDFIEGKLINPDTASIWISNDNTETSRNRRTKINIYKPDIPLKIRASSQLISTTNQFMEFQNTDIDADAAQTTIPYLDAQDVTSEPPVPLSGAGMYYKRRERSGGYIGPKIITYNFSPHVRIPEKEGNTIIA